MPPTITIVSSVPKFVSLDEHRTLVSTTPASFTDIPPVIRHTESNVKITLDPPIDGFSASEGEQGTLYVIESVLVFLSSSTGRGIQIQYPSITLHAISRADNTPSIYCQLDESQTTTTTTQDDNETVDMREMSIIPVSPSSLEAIFEALSLCASLHPDEDNGASDDDEDDAFISTDSPFETFTGDENQELSDVGRAALEHLESIIDYGSHKPPVQDADDADDKDQDKEKPTPAKEGEPEKTETETSTK